MNVFVAGQRFDSTTFDKNDVVPTRGADDEAVKPSQSLLCQLVGENALVLRCGAAIFFDPLLCRRVTFLLQHVCYITHSFQQLEQQQSSNLSVSIRVVCLQFLSIFSNFQPEISAFHHFRSKR